MRTIAGCCAHADPSTNTAASEATMPRVIDEEILDILDMTFAPKGLPRSIAPENPAVAPLFL
jgi:hypothetical protein